MRVRIAMIALLLASATAFAAGEPASSVPEFTEQVRQLGLDPAQVIDPFALTPEMRAFAQRAVGPSLDPNDQLDALQRALFYSRDFHFVYDRNATLTAAETFAEQRGNCLAFTSLFIALARSVGIDAFLVSVNHAASVGQEDDLVVLTRHVVAGYRRLGTTWLYDFSQQTSEPTVAWVPVDDLTAASMFHANLGARALRDGHVEAAHDDLEIAARLDPNRVATWVDLGVARRRAGDLAGALQAYSRAIDLEPRNGSAWTNLAVAYQTVGRAGEAEAARFAAVRDASSPYHLVAFADLARTEGDLDGAHAMLASARRHHPEVPEVWEGLSRWAFAVGNPRRAERYARHAARLCRHTPEPGNPFPPGTLATDL